jgi:hypothetical protein
VGAPSRPLHAGAQRLLSPRCQSLAAAVPGLSANPKFLADHPAGHGQAWYESLIWGSVDGSPVRSGVVRVETPPLPSKIGIGHSASRWPIGSAGRERGEVAGTTGLRGHHALIISRALGGLMA